MTLTPMTIPRYAAVLAASLLLSVSLVPGAALAAAISTAPTSVSPGASANFAVTLTANPAGEKTFTVRANVAFDPAQVELVGWSFAPKWMPLSQTGYDREDSPGGALVKTAGYPGGITSPTVLGTATFRAKAAGSSTIRITTDSLALDAVGKNLIAGAQGSTAVTVAAPLKPAPAPTTPTGPTPTPAPSTGQQAATDSAPLALVGATSTEPTEATSTATATPVVAAAAASGVADLWWVLALAALVLLGAAGAWYWRRPR